LDYVDYRAICLFSLSFCSSSDPHKLVVAGQITCHVVRTENSIERFPVNVTLLLPDRLLNPGSGSLPHVADFNGIRRRWDSRDAQRESTLRGMCVFLLVGGL
jgi:hypothetical protein